MAPVLTPAEFAVAAKVALIVLAVAWAVTQFCWLLSRYRQARRRDDLMALIDSVFGPEMERIP
jgi:hypothetical protein